MNLKMQRKCSSRSFLIEDILSLDKQISTRTSADNDIYVIRSSDNMRREDDMEIDTLCLTETNGVGSAKKASIMLPRSERLTNIQLKCLQASANKELRIGGQNRMSSALNALIQMTTSTMNKLNHEIHDSPTSFEPSLLAFYSKHGQLKKRRKTRTAFTNQQITELEHRFTLQKYLTPNDRDQIALHLGLSNAQVITWFQNRRAKMKRETEERRNDLLAAKRIDLTPIATAVEGDSVVCPDAVDLSVFRSPLEETETMAAPSLDRDNEQNSSQDGSISSPPPKLTAAAYSEELTRGFETPADKSPTFTQSQY